MTKSLKILKIFSNIYNKIPMSISVYYSPLKQSVYQCLPLSITDRRNSGRH